MSMTSVIRYFRAMDTASVVGAGKASLVFGDFTAKYLTQGGTLQSLTTETITTLGTYQAPTSSAHVRIKELANAAPTTGIYEVHFHDTQMAGTGKKLWLFLSATGTLVQPLEVDLIPYMDLVAQSAADLKDFADDGYDPATNKVEGVKLADTVTTYTGNTVQTGDSYPKVDTEVATLVTGVADIQARLPAALTAGGNIKADALKLNGATPNNVAATDIVSAGAITTSSGKVSGVILTDTVTTYTGNTVQTGDSFARLGSTGSGLTSLAPSATALSTVNWTSARAGYLDNLNIGGNVASSAEATAIQNNTRVVRAVPDVIERPDSGTTTFRIEIYLYDTTGNMEAPDSAPTLTLVNQAGTDRSSRLDSTTMALVSTGRYRVIYTADSADALEQLIWAFSVVEGGSTRVYGNSSLIVDTSAVDFTAADRTKLNTLATDYTTARAAKIDNLDVTISSRLASASYTAPLDAAGTRTAVGLASANLDTQLDALPTNAELATSQAAADDATLTAIAALNNIDAAAVWGAATRTLTAGTNIVLAKGVGVTGFNDIAATAIVSGGAINTAGGAVSTVTTLTNLPAITSNWLTAAGIAADALLAIANRVEAEIIDETDSEKVLTAITDKIASVNPDLSGLTLAAIAAAVRDVNNAAPAGGSLGAVLNAVNAKTTNLPADPADASDIAAAFAAVPAAVNVTLSASHGAGSWISATGFAVPGDAMTLTAAYDAAKTASTQASVNLVKVATDQLTFTIAGQLDSNVRYVNNIQVTGTGTVGDEWRPV